MDRVPTYKSYCAHSLVGCGGMAPKRMQAFQVVEKSKWVRKSAQGSQQALPENLVLRAVEDLFGRLGRLEDIWGAVHLQVLHIFRTRFLMVLDQGHTDPVMSLVKDISSLLTALEEKAGLSQWDIPMPSHSIAPSSVVVPYMLSPAADLAVLYLSIAHQVLPVGMVGSLHASN